MKYNEVNNEQLEKVSGGVTREEFNALKYGDSVHIIKGAFCDQNATVVSFIDDMQGGARMVAVVQLADGSSANMHMDEIVLL